MMTRCDTATEAEEPKKRERTTLRTAVLAALLHDEEGYGYDITDRLPARLGAAWDIDPKRVYQVLGQFESDGWAWSEYKRGPGKRGHLRRVYFPTPDAEQVRAKWIGERRPLPLMREDIRIWVAFARPRDAPEVLRKLEEYELDCMKTLEDSAETEEPASWNDRVTNLLRVATTEELRAEMRWITRARRDIKEYLAR
jgi:DNA-binding PadR family transcriptional regulator